MNDFDDNQGRGDRDQLPEGSGVIIWGFIAVGLVSLAFAVAQMLADSGAFR